MSDNAPRNVQQVEVEETAGEIFMRWFRSFVICYLIMNFVFSLDFMKPPKNETNISAVPSPDGTEVSDTAEHHHHQKAQRFVNEFTLDRELKLAVYLSETEHDYEYLESDKVWTHDFIYGEWKPVSKVNATEQSGLLSVFTNEYLPERHHSLALPMTSNFQNNGTLYAYITIDSSGNATGNPIHITKRTRLNYYRARGKIYKERNLLETEKEEESECIQEDGEFMYGSEQERKCQQPGENDIISFYHPNLTISLLYDEAQYFPREIPPQLTKLNVFNFHKQEHTFTPGIYINTFWNLHKDYIAVNDTLKELELHIAFDPLPLWKLQMYSSMQESFDMQASMGSMQPKDNDMFKEMLVETNPYLLIVTFIVTTLHSIFDVLAFKNDINFWKTRKTVEGLSIRTIFTNIIFQFIILLYLYDNDSSYVILVSSSIGLVIEIWKIKKAVNISFNFENKYLGLFPRLEFEDRKGYKESKTKEYDDQAFRVLSKIAIPLVVGYSIYSLVYSSHKSVYSWVLGSVVGAIYTFGFIMMTPQLFINYKLKSVAHMPWRMMTYKALNTFIDDLFAFVIKMPTMHRLACLRDDFIFFIYLYQKWAYPVDMNRRNEFEGGDAAGNKDEDEDEDENEDHHLDAAGTNDDRVKDDRTKAHQASSISQEENDDLVHSPTLVDSNYNDINNITIHKENEEERREDRDALVPTLTQSAEETDDGRDISLVERDDKGKNSDGIDREDEKDESGEEKDILVHTLEQSAEETDNGCDILVRTPSIFDSDDDGKNINSGNEYEEKEDLLVHPLMPTKQEGEDILVHTPSLNYSDDDINTNSANENEDEQIVDNVDQIKTEELSDIVVETPSLVVGDNSQNKNASGNRNEEEEDDLLINNLVKTKKQKEMDTLGKNPFLVDCNEGQYHVTPNYENEEKGRDVLVHTPSLVDDDDGKNNHNFNNENVEASDLLVHTLFQSKEEGRDILVHTPTLVDRENEIEEAEKLDNQRHNAHDNEEEDDEGPYVLVQTPSLADHDGQTNNNFGIEDKEERDIFAQTLIQSKEEKREIEVPTPSLVDGNDEMLNQQHDNQTNTNPNNKLEKEEPYVLVSTPSLEDYHDGKNNTCDNENEVEGDILIHTLVQTKKDRRENLVHTPSLVDSDNESEGENEKADILVHKLVQNQDGRDTFVHSLADRDIYNSQENNDDGRDILVRTPLVFDDESGDDD